MPGLVKFSSEKKTFGNQTIPRKECLVSPCRRQVEYILPSMELDVPPLMILALRAVFCSLLVAVLTSVSLCED